MDKQSAIEWIASMNEFINDRRHSVHDRMVETDIRDKASAEFNVTVGDVIAYRESLK